MCTPDGGINIGEGRIYMTVSMRLISLLKSLVISYIVTGIMLLIIALSLYKFGLAESTINILITAVYVVASFAGGFAVGRMVQEKKFIWGLFLGIAYAAIIMIVSFAVNGTIDFSATSAIYQMALCIGGGMLGGMLS